MLQSYLDILLVTESPFNSVRKLMFIKLYNSNIIKCMIKDFVDTEKDADSLGIKYFY